MPTLQKQYFIEECLDGGSAFGLSLKNTTPVFREQSPYQLVEVFETEKFGMLMTIDGLVMLSTRDNFLYHEMMSHPALAAHPNPKDVLIIGGGDCGTLHEVLKHKGIESATQVDIDELVTKASVQFFPELCSSNDDPRAHLHFDDGIRWVAEAEPESYDIIIIDSTDPVGPAKGLFTEAFYSNCRKALRPQGIMVQQSESPLLHMDLLTEIHSAMWGAGYDKVKTLQFPQPVYPSGWWSATLAGKGLDLSMLRTLSELDTQYYSPDVHQAAMALPPFMNKRFSALKRK